MLLAPFGPRFAAALWRYERDIQCWPVSIDRTAFQKDRKENGMISAEKLRSIRNDLPMDITIARLGSHAPLAKMIEGYFRFLCPHCGELRATVNPRNNLAHCFCCGKNLNNIDLLIELGYDFRSAVALLDQWLNQHRRNPTFRPLPAASPPSTNSPASSNSPPATIT